MLVTDTVYLNKDFSFHPSTTLVVGATPGTSSLEKEGQASDEKRKMYWEEVSGVGRGYAGLEGISGVKGVSGLKRGVRGWEGLSGVGRGYSGLEGGIRGWEREAVGSIKVSGGRRERVRERRERVRASKGEKRGTGL